MAWALVPGTLSLLFRPAAGWPAGSMAWLRPVLSHWIVLGKLNPEFYLAW